MKKIFTILSIMIYVLSITAFAHKIQPTYMLQTDVKWSNQPYTVC